MAPKGGAPKQHPPVPVPAPAPAPSSSDEEDDSTTESDDEAPKVTPPPPNNPTTQDQDSEESDSEDSDSEESDSEPPPLTTATPVTTAITPSKSPNLNSKAPASGSVPTVSNSKKRALETPIEDSTKKSRSHRIWTEKDEITMLKALLASFDGGSDPFKELEVLYTSISDALSISATQPQFKDKVKKLRERFKKKAEKDDGRTFTKAHDKQCFELAKKIWGKEASNPPKNAKGKGNRGCDGGDSLKQHVAEEKGNVNKSGDGMKAPVGPEKGNKSVYNEFKMSGLNLEAFVSKNGMDLVEGSKRGEFEQISKEVFVESLNTFAKKSHLMGDVAEWMSKKSHGG